MGHLVKIELTSNSLLTITLHKTPHKYLKKEKAKPPLPD